MTSPGAQPASTGRTRITSASVTRHRRRGHHLTVTTTATAATATKSALNCGNIDFRRAKQREARGATCGYVEGVDGINTQNVSTVEGHLSCAAKSWIKKQPAARAKFAARPASNGPLSPPLMRIRLLAKIRCVAYEGER